MRLYPALPEDCLLYQSIIHHSLQEIQAASEAATMILRIDDIIASKGGGGPPAGGMPGGMGGMGGMPPDMM